MLTPLAALLGQSFNLSFPKTFSQPVGAGPARFCSAPVVPAWVQLVVTAPAARPPWLFSHFFSGSLFSIREATNHLPLAPRVPAVDLRAVLLATGTLDPVPVRSGAGRG